MAKNTNLLLKFDLFLLSILKYNDCYGYEMTKLIRKYSDGIIDIKHGTMYPILHDLIEKGYITSYNKIVENKIRIYYHIEEDGLNYLKQGIEEYDNFINIINYILHEYEGEK